jgi:tRNA(Ile2) C34 agmatinyltransferase TiaS
MKCPNCRGEMRSITPTPGYSKGWACDECRIAIDARAVPSVPAATLGEPSNANYANAHQTLPAEQPREGGGS